MHAGIDLQVITDARGAIGRGTLQGPAGGGARNRRRQVVFEDAGKIADAERAEHENPRPRSCLAQLDALFQIGDGQPGGARLFQRAGDAHGAVAVRVRLDDADDAGRRGGPPRGGPVEGGFAGQILGQRSIVGARRVEIDARGRAANHTVILERVSFQLSVVSSKRPSVPFPYDWTPLNW